jgi:SAM-dependent methyltransferase
MFRFDWKAQSVAIEKLVSFGMLDVGCGTKPKGDVNIDFFREGFNPQTGDQIRGGFMSAREIPNFVLADAEHLPFKDESFEVAFSSHTMEHVRNPLLMLREMCRVAKRRAIVRVPHRRGSGARMPHHINYLDEQWFKEASEFLGYKGRQLVTYYDYPISSKISKIVPRELQTTLPWKGLQHFERTRLNMRTKIPFEIEARINKESPRVDSGNVRFVVVYNIPEIFERCFASSPYVSGKIVSAFYNENNEPLPTFFNKTVQEHLQENIWFVFCHQDFILKEDLTARLRGKDVEALYGPIGLTFADPRLLGMIIQANGAPIGMQLKEDTLMQTLDEMCLVAHSTVFRQGLAFDEKLGFHFYGADLCMQAYRLGFDVFAMQLNCRHQNRTLTGDLSSSEYHTSLRLFREKWKQFLPIRTTTKLVT